MLAFHSTTRVKVRLPYSPESQLGSVPKDGQDLATRCLSGVSTTRSLKGGFSQPKAERQAVEGVGKKNLLPPAATSDAKKQKQTNKKSLAASEAKPKLQNQVTYAATDFHFLGTRDSTVPSASHHYQGH